LIRPKTLIETFAMTADQNEGKASGSPAGRRRVFGLLKVCLPPDSGY
jgi:hypothetical protein